MLGIENIYIVDPGSSPPLSDYLQGFIASGVVHYQWQASTAGQLALLVPLHAATRQELLWPAGTGGVALEAAGHGAPDCRLRLVPPPVWAQVRGWGGRQRGFLRQVGHR